MAPRTPSFLPQDVFFKNFQVTGSGLVPAATEGYVLEISHVQLSLWGSGSIAPMKDDYINLVVRTVSADSALPLTPTLMTCRGTLVYDPYAVVTTWLYDAGPPPTYMASSFDPAVSSMPNFVTVQSSGESMLFDTGAEVWLSAVLATAGVIATGSLLYRFLPVDKAEFADALPAPAATQPFPFAWQRMVPGVRI